MTDPAPTAAAAATGLDPADVPVVILAGGQGMRLREETERVPKPMVRIGTRPILWHIMRHYGVHGFRRFVICLGYKGWAIKEFFLNYAEELGDIRIELRSREVTVEQSPHLEDWEITLAETGLESGSSGRVAAVARYLDAPAFMFTYGDGVGTVDLRALLRQHEQSPHAVTVTGVKAASRYGILRHDGDALTAFDEKPELMEGYISGGFFCLDRPVLDRIAELDPTRFFEEDLLPDMAASGEVGIFAHHGFWHAMDTYRDYTHLNDLWAAGDAPWRTW